MFIHLLFSTAALTLLVCEKPMYVIAFFVVYYFHYLKAAGKLETFPPPEEKLTVILRRIKNPACHSTLIWIPFSNGVRAGQLQIICGPLLCAELRQRAV